MKYLILIVLSLIMFSCKKERTKSELILGKWQIINVDSNGHSIEFIYTKNRVLTFEFSNLHDYLMERSPGAEIDQTINYAGGWKIIGDSLYTNIPKFIIVSSTIKTISKSDVYFIKSITDNKLEIYVTTSGFEFSYPSDKGLTYTFKQWQF